jgi:hypothetical protein
LFQTDDDIGEQWHAKQNDSYKPFGCYWNRVIELRSVDGESRYANLKVLMCAKLSLCRSQAYIKTELSVNKMLVSGERASLKHRSIIAIRTLCIEMWRWFQLLAILYNIIETHMLASRRIGESTEGSKSGKSYAHKKMKKMTSLLLKTLMEGERL